MRVPVPRLLVLALPVLLACCDDAGGPLCPLTQPPPPQLRVSVRDAETTAAICDAEVASRGQTSGGGQLQASRGEGGACVYTTSKGGYAPTQSAQVTVTHDGYESATTDVPPAGADECGRGRDADITVSLVPAK